MNYYLTTDTHFGHAKMQEYCGRPVGFEQLIWKGFKKLMPDDVLIHLGDVCIGNDAKWHAMFIQTLPCRKILVKGNHDKKSDVWYLNHGWDFVCESISDTLFGMKILLSHEPKPIQDYDLNIHGHLHNQLERIKRKEWVTPDEAERNKDILKTLTPKHKLIVLESNSYQLTSLKSLL